MDNKYVTCVSCREKAEASVERLRQRRIQEGVCLRCGKNKPEKGKQRCIVCLERAKEASALYRKKRALLSFPKPHEEKISSNILSAATKSKQFQDAEQLRLKQIETNTLQPIRWCPNSKDQKYELFDTLCYTCGNVFHGKCNMGKGIPPKNSLYKEIDLASYTVYKIRYCPNYECDCEIMR